MKSIGGASPVQYAYDGKGNRIRAVRNGVETRYIYDLAGNLIAEADASNNITGYYIYGAGLLAMVTPAGSVYTYHFNATGSTAAVTDKNQQIVNKYSYSPFGNIDREQETIPQPFKYVGRYGVMSEPNGLYYMRARYYDPDAKRFISEDPIGFDSGEINFYVYVQNNPINWIDPFGLYWEYSQSTGQTTYADNQTGARTPAGSGYAGRGEGWNNPDMQGVENIGPIPQGNYTIGPQQNNVTNAGVRLRNSMRLTPNPGTDLLGRGGFIIHGDNRARNNTASSGCPVLGPNIRNQIGNSDDDQLRVVP